MKRIIITCLFILVSYFNSTAQKDSIAKKDTIVQIKRGSLLLKNSSQIPDSFIINGKINLKCVRSTCHFLTDNDITHYKNFVIPKRNLAFIRHIKHLDEKLEEAFQDDKPLDDEMKEIIYELCFFSESLKQKAESNARTKVSFKEKVSMEINSNKSRRAFQYKNIITDHEAKNIDPKNISEDPQDSPFWHQKLEKVPLDKRFSHLAKLKKIKAKKEMVVIFEKASLSGSSPKINALDLDLENKWSLKWGDEVHTDVVGSHIFAALGYDVDHPYFYGENKLTLIFDGSKEIKNVEELKKKIKEIYKIDLAPFIASSGLVNSKMADTLAGLRPFVGKQFVRFKKCALEARPDRVKRIGSFVPEELSNDERRELRGALLAHQFIGNWDTREANTLLTTVHMGNYKYRISAVFSDLGTSFGVVQGVFPPDFKVGLVNEFPWEVASVKRGTIRLNNEMNAILSCYEKATYQDLLWMAKKIRSLDGKMLWSMVKKGHWPEPIAELYYQKLASRRASILKAFNLDDPTPIAFDKHLTIKVDGNYVIKDGKLVVDFERDKNPESFLSKKGRLTNYGN